jgi:hypothetical protein
MAFLKPIETDYGIYATYWHIGAILESFGGKSAEVTFYGYASKAARDASKHPLTAGKMEIVGADYAPDMTRPAVYALMKQRPEFQNAEDC